MRAENDAIQNLSVPPAAYRELPSGNVETALPERGNHDSNNWARVIGRKGKIVDQRRVLDAKSRAFSAYGSIDRIEYEIRQGGACGGPLWQVAFKGSQSRQQC